MRLHLLFLLFVALISDAAWARKPTLKSLADGRPELEGKALDSSTYVPVRTKKVANPKALYVNYRYLREKGIAIPPEGPTPEFLQLLYDVFAWAAPNSNDDPSLFSKQEKTFYADRYGGMGLGDNHGSGRAASLGKIQSKGLARTDLVNASTSFDHANGRVTNEVFGEAIWSELGQEFPYGSNRVIAIIDLGTYTPWPDGGRDRNYLLIREDPIRPAHYLPNPTTSKESKRLDATRVRRNLQHFADALPLPAELEARRSALTEQERIQAGVTEYVDRIAKQYAWGYANRLFHGATSQSNIQLDGKLIDFGTMTSLPTYAPISILTDNDPFGKIEEFKRELVKNFLDPVRKILPQEHTSAMPSTKSMLARFTRTYGKSVNENFALLSGVPREVLEKISNTRPTVIQNFGSAVEKLILAENLPAANFDKHIPNDRAKVDLQKIFVTLAEQSQGNPSLKNLSLKEILDDEFPVEDFIRTYSDFLNEALAIGKEDGITRKNFLSLMKEQANLRNQPLEELYRPDLRWEHITKLDEYYRTGNTDILDDIVDGKLQRARRWFKNSDPYVATLAESSDPLGLSVVRVRYNARRAKRELVLTSEASSDGYPFFGNLLKREDLDGSVLRYTLDNWATYHEAKVKWVGDRAEFLIDSPFENTGVYEVEFTLRSRDYDRWWKQKNGNNFRTVLGYGCQRLLSPVR